MASSATVQVLVLVLAGAAFIAEIDQLPGGVLVRKMALGPCSLSRSWRLRASTALRRSVERARANRTRANLAQRPAITPHSPRRTRATFAALDGRDQNWIPDQIGHTTAHLTFSADAQVHRRRFVWEQAIWELTPFAGEPASDAPRGGFRGSQTTRLGRRLGRRANIASWTARAASETTRNTRRPCGSRSRGVGAWARIPAVTRYARFG